MGIVQVVLFGIVATMLYLIIKDVARPFAFFMMLVASIVILFAVIKEINAIIQLIYRLGQKATVHQMYIDTVLKIIGIAYITELGANVTKDAGLSSVASKIELAGKIFILLLAIPIVIAVVELILQFVPLSNDTIFEQR